MGIKSKTITVFGKQISAIVLGLLAIAGLASAGLISYYAMVVGTATVAQSVKLDDQTCTDASGGGCTATDTFSTIAGNTIYKLHKLTNDADVDVDIQISYTPTDDAYAIGYAAEEVEDYDELDEESYCQEQDFTDSTITPTLEAGKMYAFCAEYQFAINALADEYTITTNIVPA